MKLKYFKLFLIGFILFSCSNESENPNKLLKSAEFFDKSYGNDIQQNYDIFLPENRDLNTPIVILVHGGSWISGDKTDMNLFVQNIKTSLPTYAIVNINYRLLTTTENKHPTQINDIGFLIQELKEKQDQYQISTNYYFIGVSAGAHLSLLFSYTKDLNSDVKAVCSVVGPTNFTDDAYINAGNTNFELLATTFLGDTYQNNSQLYRDASPLFQVNSSSTPTILFYGGQDPLIPISQGEDLKNELIRFDIKYSHTLYPEEGHGWDGINVIDTMNKITSFFNEIYLAK